ncbi:hypothetical protein CRG98_004665 [Punica granatum]|uniref:Uncharacterized protein n=1 Tax=Punica granatum TaxID=22663 RepID=A0A2I0L2N9_PUNGR|nr:hypothetical protein CRG98_004665 [Punica granatum]
MQAITMVVLTLKHINCGKKICPLLCFGVGKFFFAARSIKLIHEDIIEFAESFDARVFGSAKAAAKDAAVVTPLMDFVHQKRASKGASPTRVMFPSCGYMFGRDTPMPSMIHRQ